MIGTRLLERYELVAELGRGGMGVVYRARDPVLDRDVAVKMLYGGPATGAHERRFEREARMVAQLDHPAIVPIFDFGRHGEALFFVMPVVEGMTLERMMRRRLLRLGDALEILAQVADALDYSHGREVFHRDVKPENVMVRGGDDAPPRARIMDFGLAVEGEAARLTHTGALAGTLAYLSPEQILARPVDGRSDLYSLATILYECLAGQPPFTGTRFSLLYRIAHEPPPPLGERAIDAGLESLVLACLAKDPSARPRRAAELAAALRRIAAGLLDEDRRLVLGAERAELREPSRSRVVGGAVLPFVGREAELGAIQERLDAALAGVCQLVVVGGETGTGKSRLLRELERLARARGARTLRGRLSDDRSAFPFQGFCEALQDGLRRPAASGDGMGPDASPGSLDLGDLAADLVAFFPILGDHEALRSASASSASFALSSETGEGAPPGPPAFSADPGGLATDRRRLFEVLARSFSRLGAGEPLVVLFEGLHRAEASLDALQYVVRRLAPTPTLFVATYRPSAAGRDHPLRGLVRAFREDPGFLHLELGPLGRADHDRLLERLLPGTESAPARLDPELAATIWEAAEGNPLFTQELVRSLHDTGAVVRGDSGTWCVGPAGWPDAARRPEGILQVVETRLEHLGDDLREVLEAAAILGRHFDFQDLRALVETVDGLDDRVDRLLQDGILEEDVRSRGDRLRFASALLRDALEARLSRRRRRRLHRAAAEQLEIRHHDRLAAVQARLVLHWAAADDAGKTVEHAGAVGRAALTAGDVAGARRALRSALDFVDDASPTVPAVAEAELRRLLADAHRLAGDGTAALAELTLASRLAREAGDPGAATEIALAAAQTAWQARRVEATREWVERGLQDAAATQDGAPAISARLLLLGGTLANLRGDAVRARQYLGEAARLEAADEARGRAAWVASGGTLVTHLPNPVVVRSPGPRGLDPAAFEAVDDMEVLACVYEPLLRTGDDGALEPWLAADWEAEDGGRCFAVTLRQGVRFSDGASCDAVAVARSFAAAARRTARPVAALSAIEGLAEVVDGGAERLAGIEVVDPLRLRFHLRDPLPIFPALLTDLAVAVTRPGADGALLGTGPFVCEALEAGRIVLGRNGRWWRTPARLSRLVFRVDLRPEAIAEALRSEELDLARDLRADDLQDLLRRPRFRRGLVEAVRRDVYFALWNAHGPTARRLEVRRALSGAVRVRDLVWRTVGRFAEPAVGWLPPGILGHDPARRRREMAGERVAESLRQAGAPLRLRAAVHPVLASRYAELTAGLFAEWAEHGVEVEVVGPDGDEPPMEAFLRRLHDPEGIDLCLSRWLPDYEDPDNFTHSLFHSEIGHFRRHLADASLDPWLDRARHEDQPEARQRLYRQIERQLLEAGVVTPLFHDIDYRLAGLRVRELAVQAAPPWVAYARVGVEDAPARSSARSGEADAEGAEARRSTVRTAIATPLPSLEPALAYRLEPSEIVPNVFETLTVVDEGARVTPFLAEAFSCEDGGRRWHFRLREGVRFHNGRRLGSRDVRASFERLLRSRLIGADAALLGLRGAVAFARGEADEIAGLVLLSARELLCELEKPSPLFAARLSHPTKAIFPEGTVDFGASWRDGCAGTGPFRVVRLDPERRLELEANPHYWRPGVPRAERLIFELAVPAAQHAGLLRHGRISLLAFLGPRELDAFSRDPTFASGVVEAPGFSTYYLLLRSRGGPLADPALRRGVAGVLSGVAPAIARAVGRAGVPAHGFLPPGMLGFDPLPPPRPSEKADLAGLELQASLHPVFRDRYPEVWDVVATRLAAAGIKLKETVQTSMGFAIVTAAPDADLVATRWYAEYPDPDSFAGVLHSEGLDGDQVADPETDRRIEEALREPEPALRDALYREIDRAFVADGRLVPLFHEQIVRVARPELRGLRLRFRCPEVAYDELSVAG